MPDELNGAISFSFLLLYFNFFYLFFFLKSRNLLWTMKLKIQNMNGNYRLYRNHNETLFRAQRRDDRTEVNVCQNVFCSVVDCTDM